MSEPPIRRSNWSSLSPSATQNDDPLAELERIVGRREQTAEAKSGAADREFLGIDEAQFEAAFHALEQPTAAKAAEMAPKRVEPAFPSFSDSVLRATERKSPPPAGPGTEFESRADAFDFDARAAHGAAKEDFSTAEEDFAQADHDYMLEGGRKRSGIVTTLAVTGLVLVAVVGALAYSWVGSAHRSGTPIVIKADPRPTKTQPEQVVAEQQPSNKLIYDRLGAQDTGNDKIVPREEQPMNDLSSVPQGTSQSPRVIVPNPIAPPANGLNEPRRVATTTIRVKPDGTFESVSSQPASSSPAPVPAPSPQQPQIASSQPAPQTAAPSPPSIAVTPDGQAEEKPAPSTPHLQQRSPPETAEAEPAPIAIAPAKTKARLPAAQAPQHVASIQPATASSGGYVVQVSSQKNEAGARSTYTALQSRFPSVLGSYQPQIKAVSLGARGTFYRVRVGPLASRDEATALCSRLKSVGGDCVVTPN